MRLFAGRVATASSFWLFAGGMSIMISLAALQPAHAVETQVRVDIAGSTAPDMQIESSTSVVSSMPIILTGRISNLTQVRVFVDNIYTDTIPLTPSDTSFTYSLWVSAGTHVVKLIGISAYTSTDVEKEITVEYTPPKENSMQSPGTLSSGSNVHTSGIVIGGAPPAGGDTTPPSSSPGSPTIPQWAVRLLVPLDIVNPARVDETPRTLVRFFLFGFGLPIVLFAQPALLLYRRARYGMLNRIKRRFPLFMRKNPIRVLRLFGIVLLLAAFFWV